MSRLISIKCLNDNKTYKYPLGTSLAQIAKEVIKNPPHPILGVRINNSLKELAYEIFKPKQIKFIDITDLDGTRMYWRSMLFVLIKAVEDLWPESVLSVKNSISRGLYCEVDFLENPLTIENIASIKNRMSEIIQSDIPIVRTEMETSEALQLFEKEKLFEKVKLFKNRTKLYTSVYSIDKMIGYFYGALVPSTGYLKVFDLVKYHEGIILRFPKPMQPDVIEEMVEQEKMYEIFKEHKRGAKIIGVEGVGSLNDIILTGGIGEIIKINEALHEKKIAKIADQIEFRKEKVKLVLIAGPSSSGKTSFCKRLAIQLKVIGFKPLMLSLDNYFVDRDNTPLDENGDYDFECLEAIDVKLFNENVLDMISGTEVLLPRFDFQTGKREFYKEPIKCGRDNIIIVEGIHGLNPKLSSMIPLENKFRIYVSALTQIAIDNHNRIPTTDNRVLRRIVRDFKYRGYSAYDTLKRWPSVRRGEEINIFPFQEEADATFNSALLYEFGVLKTHAEPILSAVQENYHEYSEAKRLLKFLSYFLPIGEKEIPPTSILREFLGGSSFKY